MVGGRIDRHVRDDMPGAVLFEGLPGHSCGRGQWEECQACEEYGAVDERLAIAAAGLGDEAVVVVVWGLPRW